MTLKQNNHKILIKTIMKTKLPLLVFIFTICMLNTTTSKASEPQHQSTRVYYFSLNSIIKDTIIVEKTTNNEMDIYTFVAEKVLSSEIIPAIEARFKVIVEGFISLSVDNNNRVKLITNNSLISQENVDFLLNTTIRLYEYTNYKMEK